MRPNLNSSSVLHAKVLLGAFAFFRSSFLDGWRLAAFAIALLVVVPLIVVLTSLFSPEQEIWRHLVEHVLPGLLANTLKMTLGVSVGVTLLGVSLAWLTAACEFPGRKFFSWALLLPLAVPAYVTAFVFIAWLDFTGPVQTMLRTSFGSSAWFPSIRSGGGVVLVMTLCLAFHAGRDAQLGNRGISQQPVDEKQIPGAGAAYRPAGAMAALGVV